MSILLNSLIEKQGMFQWVKDTADRFLLPFIAAQQRSMFMQHISKMEALDAAYEVRCEISQDAKGTSMKITTYIQPARPQ